MLRLINFHEGLRVSLSQHRNWVTLYAYNHFPSIFQEFPTSSKSLGYVLRNPRDMYFTRDYTSDNTYSEFRKRAHLFYKEDLKMWESLRKRVS